ncbi:MAG: hypothetical protein CVV44_01205 [Spirochaetae bacterium HGW-Spirochaetae-1]|jgi:hypothetical protein|nr:MAG: hypothetical protein CVV44_01205 [Spirochaetae bacterium HGW-Spirochaetae-1]
MKIDSGGIIRIPGKRSLSQFLSTMKEGAEIPARIVRRFEGKEALIDLGGQKIRAEFLKGLPGSNHLILILDEKKDDTYFFRITASVSREGHLDKIRDFLLSGVSENLKNTGILNVNRYLSGNPAGIFEMNLFLLNPRKEPSPRGKGLAELFNAMISRGINSVHVQTISAILLSLKLDPALLIPLLRLLRQDGDDRDLPFLNDQNATDESIDEIFDAVDTLDEKPLKDKLIGLMAEIFQKNDDSSDIWELPLPCGKDIIPLRYAGDANSCIVAADFSRLGKVEILVQKASGALHITVFTDSPAAEKQLRDSGQELMALLPDAGIKFYYRQSIIDKLVEINSYYAVNSQFDIKI